MKSLIDILKCGNVKRYNDACYYRISNISDITENIIPLFKKYPILSHPFRGGRGEKSKDFSDFCEVLEMIKDKKHLTKEGLEQIRRTKAGMNTGRSKTLPPAASQQDCKVEI